MNSERTTSNAGNRDRHSVPPVDIYETENEYVIKADLPGLYKDDLDITVHDNKLEISGKPRGDEIIQERKYAEFETSDYYRSFNVGNDINNSAISAALNDGVLTLKLPKRDEIKPRKIQIAAS